ncbi:MAG: metallopeptidase family protein [Patescibacteria group bacterium]|nr:metallopeptidase family protein [Patescibacteria group bacterium]
MTENEFEQLVAEAVKSIPERFRERLVNLDIVVEDCPTPQQAATDDGLWSEDDDLLGLYEGVPMLEQGIEISGLLPGKITLFREAIEDEAGGDAAEIAVVVRETVWHEVAHHLGFGEDDAYRLEEKGRG